MARSVSELTEADRAFLVERHLATLTTFRADGSAHVVPVCFTFDESSGLVRMITSADSQKAINSRDRERGVVCQVDGGRWLTLEGSTSVSDDPDRVGEGERRHVVRYKPPRENPRRVVIELTVDRVLGSS